MEDIIAKVVAVVVVGGAFVWGAINGFREVKREREKAAERVQEAESRLAAEPEKAKPAWDLARVTLESYFSRNLSQVAWIFWLSVVVMVAGFGVVIWGVMHAINTPAAVAPAVIATLAGVITEFIGATFLFIYRSTIQQAINYSRTLERINSVGMAMQILDTMTDKVETDDLKSKTKATLVELLVRQAYESKDNVQDGRGGR